MSPDHAISYGIFDCFTWIRCEGKGSFIQSSALKECAEMRRAAGELRFVIDLQACTGMDSTFMGFLAGLASRLSKRKGRVEIATPGERNRQSLEDLGLDFLLHIEPEDASWQGREDTIRAALRPFDAKRLPDIRERTRHVLDSHRTLASTNSENARRFSSVIEVLEKQDKPSGPAAPRE